MAQKANGVLRTVLDETQIERDREIARYLRMSLDEVQKNPVGKDRHGPPIYVGEDFVADSYVYLYEKLEHADIVDALRSFGLFIVEKRGDLVRRAEKMIGKDLHEKRILDFGCGVGTHGLYLLQCGAGAVDFLDVDGPVFAFTQWRVQQRKPDFAGDIGFLRPGSKLGAQKYDAILCIDVLEHIADPLTELIRILKALKRGGLLVLQVGMHLNPRQGHFKKSRDRWLSKRTRHVIRRKLVKLDDYFFVKK